MKRAPCRHGLPEPINADIGLRVREARSDKRLTKAFVAESLQLPLNRIVSLEIGGAGIRIADLLKVAALLRVSPAYLLTGYDLHSAETDDERAMLKYMRRATFADRRELLELAAALDPQAARATAPAEAVSC